MQLWYSNRFSVFIREKQTIQNLCVNSTEKFSSLYNELSCDGVEDNYNFFILSTEIQILRFNNYLSQR